LIRPKPTPIFLKLQIIGRSIGEPEPRRLAGSDRTLPYVFIGDEAFPLLENLMRPYPGDNLTLQQQIFNYRFFPYFLQY